MPQGIFVVAAGSVAAVRHGRAGSTQAMGSRGARQQPLGGRQDIVCLGDLNAALASVPPSFLLVDLSQYCIELSRHSI